MKIVKCKCGASFDVAAMRPGSTFACGKCRSPVAVPAEAPPATVAMSPDQMKRALEEARSTAAASSASPPAAGPKAQPRLPPAMQARAQATAGTVGVRAAGAAPPVVGKAPPPPVIAKAPAPAVPKPRPRRDDAAESEPAKKPPVAMYVSIAGVVVLLGVVGFMAFSGGDKSKETAKSDQPQQPPAKVEPPPPPPKPKDPTNFDDYLTMTGQEQHDALVSRKVAASTDVAAMQKYHEWLTNPKVVKNDEAKKTDALIIEEAIQKDPNCEWARTARGDHRVKELLAKCKSECTLAFSMMDPDEKAVLARLDAAEATPWADAAEWAKLEALVASIRARDEKMAKDPRYKMAEQKRDWVRLNPLFTGVEITWILADPYVIFQEVKKQDVRDTERKYNDKLGATEEVPKDGTVAPQKVRQNEIWAEKGKLFAKRDATIFVELNRHFRELWADRFKLPTLQEKGRMLTGLVMWNRASFDKLLAATGQPVAGFIRAFYSPQEQKIFHYLSDESLQNEDEIHCAEGRVQKQADQVTFHEGTHQLQHEYAAIFRGAPLTDSSQPDPRKAMWFEEGIAEFMGAVEVDQAKVEYLEDVKWFHNRILLERIQQSRGYDASPEAVRSARELSRRWTIKEFLQPNQNDELLKRGEKLAPGQGEWMANLFYSRAWAFCHFLWYYADGKYRAKFNDYFETVLKGTQSSEKFAKIMGRPNMNDWGPIEKEYEWYWDGLLRRKVGKDRVTHQWALPTTDPPTGKVEDDTDWCDNWNEQHKADSKDGK